jgi:hypothetical protein
VPLALARIADPSLSLSGTLDGDAALTGRAEVTRRASARR